MSSEKATFQLFLDRMRNPDASDLVRIIKSFIFHVSNEISPQERVEKVESFLSSTEQLIRGHSLWVTASEEEIDGVGEALEKYVMLKIYQHVFAANPEEITEDQDVYNKIAALQKFVLPSNLDVPTSFQHNEAFGQATRELQKMTSFKAPKDKLVCLLNSCKIVNSILLTLSDEKENDFELPGADEFLPLLIYTVIKANPPQLVSNLNYIQRFRHPSRLVSEQAYFFTNALSAMAFIQNLTAASLSMKDDAFCSKMRESYASLGLPPPPQLESKIESQGRVVEPKHGEEEVERRVEDLIKDFRFAFSELEDLRVGDVKLLLQEHKEIVVRYVQLMLKHERPGDIPAPAGQSKLRAEEGSKRSVGLDSTDTMAELTSVVASHDGKNGDLVDPSEAQEQGHSNGIGTGSTVVISKDILELEKSLNLDMS